MVKGVFGSILLKGKGSQTDSQTSRVPEKKLLLGLALGSPKMLFGDKPFVFGGIIKVWVSTLVIFWG